MGLDQKIQSTGMNLGRTGRRVINIDLKNNDLDSIEIRGEIAEVSVELSLLLSILGERLKNEGYDFSFILNYLSGIVAQAYERIEKLNVE